VYAIEIHRLLLSTRIDRDGGKSEFTSVGRETRAR
jgi:hypothetical protein